jgi:hypothetical protein
MSEFFLGFIAGLVSCGFALITFSLCYVGAKADREFEHDVEQPDIRLTKIKSEHIRSIKND